MKISEIQTFNNMQFAGNNTAKVNGVIFKGSPKANSFVKKKKTLPIPQEIKSRVENYVKEFRRKQTYDNYNALQKEKDIKYKEMIG